MLREVVHEVLNSSRIGTPRPTARQAQERLSAVSARDYARQLRRLFDRQQISEIFGEFSKWVPSLNVTVIRECDPRRLEQIAAGFGAAFSAIPFGAAGRSGLRGFYVRKGEKIGKPLIYVNAAIHPVVMASSFWHEIGHHLTARMFDDSRHELNLLFRTDYHRHLEDPLETAADIASILAGYPKPAAMRLFARSLSAGSAPDVDSLLASVRPHLHSISGFEFEKRFPAMENLRYLAAMLHCAKLRWALLSEFGI